VRRRDRATASSIFDTPPVLCSWRVAVLLVHVGYRKYRRPLLEKDVRIYELKSET
jgi:hypothetical protein